MTNPLPVPWVSLFAISQASLRVPCGDSMRTASTTPWVASLSAMLSGGTKGTGPFGNVIQGDEQMTKVVDIQKKLGETAQLVLEYYTELTGSEANDYAVNDVCRLIAGLPLSLAKSKRTYIDKLQAEVRAATAVDQDGKDLPEDQQGHAYHQAVQRFERLALRIEVEAQGFDQMFENCHKPWYEGYQEREWASTSTAKPKLSKQEKAAMDAIKARYKVA